MSTEKGSDKFDKDIDALYLQRKNNIQAPDITFEGAVADNSPKKRYRMKEVVSILMLGGVASFGIFAVINHLAQLPENTQQPPNESITLVEVIDIDKFDKANQPINLTPPKEQKKVRQTLAEQPTRNFEINTGIQVKPKPAKAISINSLNVEAIALVPNKLQPHRVHPTFKVMPDLSRHSASRQSGRVKLTYTLSDEGTVENIAVVESNVNRDLERSAQEALSQWRYAPKSSLGKALQVEFQFNRK
ncbi:TonB family protein [Colwellia sp. RE-S-Sl-9]